MLSKLQEFASRLNVAGETAGRLAVKSGPHQRDNDDAVAANNVLFEQKAIDVRTRLGDVIQQTNQILVETSVSINEWQTAETLKHELSQWLSDMEAALKTNSLKQSQIQVSLLDSTYWSLFIRADA